MITGRRALIPGIWQVLPVRTRRVGKPMGLDPTTARIMILDNIIRIQTVRIATSSSLSDLARRRRAHSGSTASRGDDYAHVVDLSGFPSIPAPFHRLPTQFGRNTAMRFKFHARHTSVHSPLTFFKPRSENWPKPITDLMMPNTGSTVCLRSA